jgi:Mlc titration factor MtfA (ptsG expression regulator)
MGFQKRSCIIRVPYHGSGKIAEIKAGNSDIDEYAALGLSEFFSAVGDYFFRKPEQLAENHPALFQFFDRMFTGKLKQPGEKIEW